MQTTIVKRSNREPKGEVNLERSYQICAAVIQNSPNRAALQSQLCPPPVMKAINESKTVAPSWPTATITTSSPKTRVSSIGTSSTVTGARVTRAVVPVSPMKNGANVNRGQSLLTQSFQDGVQDSPLSEIKGHPASSEHLQVVHSNHQRTGSVVSGVTSPLMANMAEEEMKRMKLEELQKLRVRGKTCCMVY